LNFNEVSDFEEEEEDDEELEDLEDTFYEDELTEEKNNKILDMEINIENLNKLYSVNSLISLKNLLDIEGDKLDNEDLKKKKNYVINSFLKEEEDLNSDS
jgi:hypothetical protein